MVSIIRLRYPKHECDDELIMLDLPILCNHPDIIIKKAEEILSRPVTDEEMEEDYDFLDVLDERLKEIEEATGCLVRIMYTDLVADAGF